MSWLNKSIMAQRGVAARATGKAKRKPSRHELDEAAQGKYHFTMGPYTEPVLTIAPGDSVIVETRNAFDGKVKTEKDDPRRLNQGVDDRLAAARKRACHHGHRQRSSARGRDPNCLS
jgi:hypothetical protein